jgi:Tol biopolymer transport system component
MALPFFKKKGCFRINTIYDVNTREVSILLDDPDGAVRDPQVHYNGDKIIFSYRPGQTSFYHLYEINTDGNGLKQLTVGNFDDIEPTYLADGNIIFVSSRAKRWVNCMITQVAILYGCDADGKNIHALSGNIEPDNTPWPCLTVKFFIPGGSMSIAVKRIITIFG